MCELTVTHDEEELLAAVESIAPLIEADSLLADANGRLTSRVVDALSDAGLLRMRLPIECGGRELSIGAQLRVIAALAELDSSTAWCVMVGSNAVAKIGTTMPTETVQCVFENGIPVCSVVATATGSATPVDGGYLLSGEWRLASGIHHSDWVYASSFVGGDRSLPLRFVVRTTDIHIVDSWHAVGLRGTGSADFSMQDAFVPAHLTTTDPERQLRGERCYDLPALPMVEAYEHMAFAIGVARRALRELVDSLARDEVHRSTADRESVHIELGRAATRLAAVEALAISFAGRADEAATGGPDRLVEWGPAFPRAIAAEATETALECVHLAFRRGASRSIYAPNVVERLLRDMNAASTHIVVDDTSFAAHGTTLLAKSANAARKAVI